MGLKVEKKLVGVSDVSTQFGRPNYVYGNILYSEEVKVHDDWAYGDSLLVMEIPVDKCMENEIAIWKVESRVLESIGSNTRVIPYKPEEGTEIPQPSEKSLKVILTLFDLIHTKKWDTLLDLIVQEPGYKDIPEYHEFEIMSDERKTDVIMALISIRSTECCVIKHDIVDKIYNHFFVGIK